jgi:hypothetical protein
MLKKLEEQRLLTRWISSKFGVMKPVRARAASYTADDIPQYTGWNQAVHMVESFQNTGRNMHR